jgi:ubiquinone/menaquinone biosynthesis C-methylase UbiE
MSFLEFKHHYYKNYSRGTVRMGQLFILVFMKGDTSKYNYLWNEVDDNLAEEVIYQFIMDNNWDMMSMRLLNEELL